MTVSSRIRRFLESHGVAFELFAHPHTETTEASAHAAYVPADHIAKAVLVRDGRGHAMVVIPGNARVKLAALRAVTGRAYELAPEDDVDALFADCQPGAVPALGPAYGMDTYLDEALTTLAHVYFEAGDHESLVRLSGQDFLALLQGTRRGHFSHDA